MAAKKKIALKSPEPEYPQVSEMYWIPFDFRHGPVVGHPSCANGDVRIEKYRITIEKVEEPKEVYQERLVRLWRENERNWYHSDPMRYAAMKYLGITREEASALLNHDIQGIDYKKPERR